MKFITLAWDMNYLAGLDPKLYVSHVIPYSIGDGRPASVSEATLSSGRDVMKLSTVDDFPAEYIVLGYNVDFPRNGCWHLVYAWSIKDECVRCFDLRANQFTGRWQSEGESAYWDGWKGVVMRTLFYRTGNYSHETEVYLSAIGYAGKGDFLPYDGRKYHDQGFRWTVNVPEGVEKALELLEKTIPQENTEGVDIDPEEGVTVTLKHPTKELVMTSLQKIPQARVWKDDILVKTEEDIGEIDSIY